MFFDSSNIFGVRLVQLFNQLPTLHFSAIAFLLSSLSLSMPDFFPLFFYLFIFIAVCEVFRHFFIFSDKISEMIQKPWSHTLSWLRQLRPHGTKRFFFHSFSFSFSLPSVIFISLFHLFIFILFFHFLFFILSFYSFSSFIYSFFFLSFSFGLRSNHAKICGSLSITEIK